MRSSKRLWILFDVRPDRSVAVLGSYHGLYGEALLEALDRGGPQAQAFDVLRAGFGNGIIRWLLGLGFEDAEMDTVLGNLLPQLERTIAAVDCADTMLTEGTDS